MFEKQIFMRDANAAGGSGENTTTSETDNTTMSWQDYLNGLPDDQRATVQKLYETENQSLLNAVKATREERVQLSAALRDAAKQAEKGSTAEAALLDQAAKLEEATKKADFFAEAVTQKCSNPKAAWALTKSENLFNRSGLPDWAAIRTSAPELFGSAPKPKAKAGAGQGTDQDPPGQTINEFIRNAAGARSITNEG